jgi:hypothetical protein
MDILGDIRRALAELEVAYATTDRQLIANAIDILRAALLAAHGKGEALTEIRNSQAAIDRETGKRLSYDNDTPADVAALAEALTQVMDPPGWSVLGVRRSVRAQEAYRNAALAILAALPEGWHLSNRAEAGAEVLALRAALFYAERVITEKDPSHHSLPEIRRTLEMSAPEAERITKDIEAPWRAFVGARDAYYALAGGDDEQGEADAWDVLVKARVLLGGE